MSEHSSSKQAVAIDIVSDVVCPWCYIGKRNLEAALAQLPEVEATIQWRPYQLDPTIPAEGLDRQAYMTRKFGDRVPQIQTRITDAAKESGLDLHFDAIKRSPNTLDAHRVIRWAWAAGRQDAVAERLFRAFFVEGQDIGDRAVLTRCAEEAGLDGAIVRALLDDGADAESVRDEVEQARALGVSGVPFYILDQDVGVSGAQPPDSLARVIRKAIERRGAVAPAA